MPQHCGQMQTFLQHGRACAVWASGFTAARYCESACFVLPLCDFPERRSKKSAPHGGYRRALVLPQGARQILCDESSVGFGVFAAFRGGRGRRCLHGAFAGGGNLGRCGSAGGIGL